MLRNLLAYYRKTLFYVSRALRLVNHCDGVVGIAYAAFALGVHKVLLTAEQILARALSVSNKIARGGKERPLHVAPLAQIVERRALHVGKRLIDVGEAGGILHLHGVLLVRIKAARAAHDEQADAASAQNVTQMLQ